MFSTIVRHPVSITSHAPVVFLQYLAALAIVQGIKTYDVGYKDLPVKLKWPNDICKSCFWPQSKLDMLTPRRRH